MRTTMKMIHILMPPQQRGSRRRRRRERRKKHQPTLILSSSFSLLLLFLLNICVYKKVVKAVEFEPFIVQWCIEQFPNQLLIDNQNERLGFLLPIEAFLSKWCFEQNPNFDSLKNQILIKQSLFADLSVNHHTIPIEIYLNEWGQKHEFESQEIEPYIDEWCGEQIYTVLKDEASKSKFHPLVGYLQEIPIEPYVGEWCFASYPTNLGGNNSNLDQLSVINQLKSNHIEIEKFVQYWYDNTTTTNTNVDEEKEPKNTNSSNDDDDVIMIFLFIIISIIFLCGLIFVIRSKQQQQQQEIENTSNNNNSNNNNNGGGSNSIGVDVELS